MMDWNALGEETVDLLRRYLGPPPPSGLVWLVIWPGTPGSPASLRRSSSEAR